MSDNENISLNLSKAKEKQVRTSAALYQAVYIKSFDAIFEIAKGIKILRDEFHGSGDQGAFSRALIKYGFTNRRGDAEMDKSLRSIMLELLEHETEVRAWWDSAVPESQKDIWLSARSVHRHWHEYKKPPADADDLDRPTFERDEDDILDRPVDLQLVKELKQEVFNLRAKLLFAESDDQTQAKLNQDLRTENAELRAENALLRAENQMLREQLQTVSPVLAASLNLPVKH